jgi:hypothetical protein
LRCREFLALHSENKHNKIRNRPPPTFECFRCVTVAKLMDRRAIRKDCGAPLFLDASLLIGGKGEDVAHGLCVLFIDVT